MVGTKRYEPGSWVPAIEIARACGLDRSSVLKKIRKAGVGETRPYATGNAVVAAMGAPGGWVNELLDTRAEAVSNTAV